MKKNHVLTWAGVFSLMLLLQTTVLGGSYLPSSTIWEGSTIYGSSTDSIYAYVEYAVYSSADLPDEIADFTTDDAYIYVYKIYNIGSSSSDLAIASMILSGGGTASADNIGSYDDDSGGVEPDTSEINTTDDTFVWEFTQGLLIAEAETIFLVFTSDYAPIEGTLTLSNTYGDGIPTVGDSTDATTTAIPEPTTVTLLSIGTFGLLKRLRRRS